MTAATSSWRGMRVVFLTPTPTHPQDFGNRKRAYTICASLKARGAAITLLHYPVETDWRDRLPEAASAAMRAAWDGYHLIPVTRPPHAPAIGTDHTVDEWWDPAIGDFLKWLFSVQHFDALIVNYTWLSKALTFAPGTTVKILDTNDQFSGRRQMLANHGIAPEFFHTTEPAEAEALARADIVWAIKEQEQLHFERLGARQVVTLPHLDAASFVAPPAADPDGFLRVGIIGARNNVNLINVTHFLRAAMPIFERHFAPVKLVIAGSICDELGPVDERFVELMGRVPTVDAFYRAVDLVAIPIAFSTGLKIKAGEALSFGVPILSLAHAFEGYFACHRGQQLADMADLAERIVEVAFSRTLIDDLRAASRAAFRTVQRAIDAAIEKTAMVARHSGRRVLFCIDSAVLRPCGVARAALDSVIDLLRQRFRVTVLVIAGDPEEAASACDDAPTAYPVFIAAELGAVATPPPPAGGGREEGPTTGVVPPSSNLLPRGEEAYGAIHAMPTADAVASFGARAVFVDALSPLLDLVQTSSADLFIRPELIALASGHAPHPNTLATLAQRFGECHVLGDPNCAEIAALAHATQGDVVNVPLNYRSLHLRRLRLRTSPAERGWVAILGQADFPGEEFAAATVTECGFYPVSISLEAPEDEESDQPRVRPGEFIEQLEAMETTLPLALVDMSFGATGLAIIRELCQRHGVPIITGTDAVAPPATTERGETDIVADYAGLYWAIRRQLRQPVQAAAGAAREFESDAGWDWVVRRLQIIPLSTPAELMTEDF